MTLRGSPWALTTLFFFLMVGVIVPYLIWGELFEEILGADAGRTWLESYGHWAWAAGIGLLISDILLPIPGTVVMSGLGWIYGWFLGGLIASFGSFLSGIVAYLLCRWLGQPVARWIAGEKGLARGETFFSNQGSWIVALSRWTPVLPEAVACLAGMVRMRWSTFVLSLACGSLPLGFVFAAIGDLGQASPYWAVVLSALLPLVLWSVVWRSLVRRKNKGEPSPQA